MNFDKSGILESLLAKEYKGNSMLLLGELQYSFVKFLLGEHYDSFE
jgi:A1 cistron-splicing factor AAR2